MSKKSLLKYVVTALILSGCSTVNGPSESAEPVVRDLDFRGSDCILIRTIRDYTPLDRENLLVRGPGRRAYFVTLVRPAIDMRGSIGFRVDSRDDRLCPYGGDSLVFGSFGNDRVTVRAISRLSQEQEEQLLIRYGLDGRDESATPVAPDPEKVKAAEVEELG